MNRLFLLLAIVALAACPPRPRPIPPSSDFKPEATPAGTPSGERVTASIGPDSDRRSGRADRLWRHDGDSGGGEPGEGVNGVTGQSYRMTRIDS